MKDELPLLSLPKHIHLYDSLIIHKPLIPQVATSLNNLAGLLAGRGQTDAAWQLYQRALAIREQVLGPAHPDVAQLTNNIAGLYRKQGRIQEAQEAYQKSLDSLTVRYLIMQQLVPCVAYKNTSDVQTWW